MTNAAMTVAIEMTMPFKMKGRAKKTARVMAPAMMYLVDLFIG